VMGDMARQVMMILGWQGRQLVQSKGRKEWRERQVVLTSYVSLHCN
jgi:hypothetical protein